MELVAAIVVCGGSGLGAFYILGPLAGRQRGLYSQQLWGLFYCLCAFASGAFSIVRTFR